MLLPFNFQKDPFLILDFSTQNPDLPNLDLTNTALFTHYVFGKLRDAGTVVGVGGYNEHRAIYHRSAHFGDADPARDGPPCDGPPCDGPRQIHLGIDVWAAVGTPVSAPLNGVVHSFQDNKGFGDYGPTVILEHKTETGPLFSLYGHLSRASLRGLHEGKLIDAGERFAEFGPYPENGDWPPHLHFQLMTDMLGKRGDFPGVCSLTDRKKFLSVCPDPNTLLKIPGL